MPDENGLSSRVTALENWRIAQENWRLAKEKLDETRHEANLAQFSSLKSGQSETARHLLSQDGKLDKIAEITTDIRLKLSGSDGEQKAMDKATRDDLAYANAKAAARANLIAGASIFLGPIVGALIYWFFHK